MYNRVVPALYVIHKQKLSRLTLLIKRLWTRYITIINIIFNIYLKNGCEKFVCKLIQRMYDFWFLQKITFNALFYFLSYKNSFISQYYFSNGKNMLAYQFRSPRWWERNLDRKDYFNVILMSCVLKPNESLHVKWGIPWHYPVLRHIT